MQSNFVRGNAFACIYIYGRVTIFDLKDLENTLRIYGKPFLSHPCIRPRPEVEPDPETRTSFTIYTFSNTVKINIA